MNSLPDWLLVGRWNNYGLTQDAELIAGTMRSMGASYGLSERRSRAFIDRLLQRHRARRVLHIERAHPNWFSAATENWLVPNQERFPLRHVERLRRVEKVLAKTKHAEAIFSNLGVNTAYLGFSSSDRLDPTVHKRWDRFLHLAGASTLKGTEDLIALWTAHPKWPQLIIVQKAQNASRALLPNVNIISGYLPDYELKHLQNSCGIHLCPSRSEGWGHHLVEGLSVGSIVITTDAPPMNEHVSAEYGFLVPYYRQEPRHLGFNYYTDIVALSAAIQEAHEMRQDRKELMGRRAREAFLAIQKGFQERAREVFQ